MALGTVFLPLFGNVTLSPLPAAQIWIAVQSLLNRIWTGIFAIFSATLLLSSTLPVSSIFTYMAACGAEGVTRILNSSSVMFFRSNIIFIPFFILEQKFCIPTERSLAAMRQHFQVLSNPS